MTNSEDTDEIRHNVPFHKGLHYRGQTSFTICHLSLFTAIDYKIDLWHTVNTGLALFGLLCLL